MCAHKNCFKKPSEIVQMCQVSSVSMVSHCASIIKATGINSFSFEVPFLCPQSSDCTCVDPHEAALSNCWYFHMAEKSTLLFSFINNFNIAIHTHLLLTKHD